VRLGFDPRQAMAVHSDKASRVHPRRIVLKPTQADEFEMPIRCEWIYHQPPSDRHVGLSFVVVVGALLQVLTAARGPTANFCADATTVRLSEEQRTTSARCERFGP